MSRPSGEFDLFCDVHREEIAGQNLTDVVRKMKEVLGQYDRGNCDVEDIFEEPLKEVLNIYQIRNNEKAFVLRDGLVAALASAYEDLLLSMLRMP